MDIYNILEKEFQIKREYIDNTIKLIDEGNTIPFIARYRKEMTGEMSDVTLRQLNERLTYLRNLESRKEDGEGVLITEFAGLHSGANAISGDFSLASKGFYVKDGKKAYPVDQITVAGNFFDLLKQITVVGDDLTFPLSSIGSPTVIATGLSVAGK